MIIVYSGPFLPPPINYVPPEPPNNKEYLEGRRMRAAGIPLSATISEMQSWGWWDEDLETKEEKD